MRGITYTYSMDKKQIGPYIPILLLLVCTGCFSGESNDSETVSVVTPAPTVSATATQVPTKTPVPKSTPTISPTSTFTPTLLPEDLNFILLKDPDFKLDAMGNIIMDQSKQDLSSLAEKMNVLFGKNISTIGKKPELMYPRYAAMSDANKYLAVSDHEVINLWDIEKDLFMGAYPTGGSYSLSFSPEGEKLVSAGSRNKIIIFDLDDFSKSIKYNIPYRPEEPSRTYLSKALLSPDGKYLALLRNTDWQDETTPIFGTIDIYDFSQPAALKHLMELPKPLTEIRKLDFVYPEDFQDDDFTEIYDMEWDTQTGDLIWLSGKGNLWGFNVSRNERYLLTEGALSREKIEEERANRGGWIPHPTIPEEWVYIFSHHVPNKEWFFNLTSKEEKGVTYNWKSNVLSGGLEFQNGTSIRYYKNKNSIEITIPGNEKPIIFDTVSELSYPDILDLWFDKNENHLYMLLADFSSCILDIETEKYLWKSSLPFKPNRFISYFFHPRNKKWFGLAKNSDADNGFTIFSISGKEYVHIRDLEGPEFHWDSLQEDNVTVLSLVSWEDQPVLVKFKVEFENNGDTVKQSIIFEDSFTGEQLLAKDIPQSHYNSGKINNIETINNLLTVTYEMPGPHGPYLQSIAIRDLDAPDSWFNLMSGETPYTFHGNYFASENTTFTGIRYAYRIFTTNIYSKENRSIKLFEWYTEPITAITFSPDGKTIISADEKYIKKWDHQTDKQTPTVITALDDPITSFTFSADGEVLFGGSTKGRVNIFNSESLELLGIIMPEKE